MKTAISVPDEVFEQATKWAAALGIGRSAFFTQAARHYVRELEGESLTAQINKALERIGDDDESTRDVVAYGRRRLAADAEDW